MDPKTNETAMSRREMLRASGAAAISALVAGLTGCAGTTSPRQAANAEPAKAQITVLYDAFGKASAMQKDWGYAALVESGGKRMLFDTGNNPDILAHNVKTKGIDLSTLDFAVMSHRHGDHMGAWLICCKSTPR
jgi:7,8-dihydropterin-6-yl-methyl-4-(beta-D-ribofuranosyl)aminobenzene 5'-phosphate synthase